MNAIKASGVILAGGKSSRMKFNKAFAEIGGMPAIQIIINKFTPFFDETFIISNELELFKDLGLKVYPDVYPYFGPVSGIHSGLSHAANDNIFVIGCDLPFINMNLVQYMLKKIDSCDCVVPEICSRLQPISSVYSKSSLPVFEECLKHQKLKLTLLLTELNMVVIKEKELKRFGNVNDIFLNVNNYDMLEKARILAGRLL